MLTPLTLTCDLLSMLPVLYSFRRCPYAIRARLALYYTGMQVELREVVLSDMPQGMLKASPKATVPVMVLPDGEVIDESWDIMMHALSRHDPDNWRGTHDEHIAAALPLIQENDFVFKPDLDRYKYADRHPQHPAEYYRKQGEEFLQMLEHRLQTGPYLLGDKISIADAAIFPFIRQFAGVDKAWFDTLPYTNLQGWLSKWLVSDLFVAIMDKCTVWQPDAAPVYFGRDT